MAARHDEGVLPLVPGNADQLRFVVRRFGGDDDVGGAIDLIHCQSMGIVL
jgi:hypothetical protein